MTEDPSASVIDAAALQTFMQRVRTTLGHDLRTSLGTIVNYASVLDEEEVRDLPRRIRVEAMQSAEMVQLLLDATILAASVPAFSSTEPGTILRSVIAEITGDTSVRMLAPPHANGAEAFELESEVVGFVWRAFLVLEHRLGRRPLSGACEKVERVADRIRISLTFNPAGGGLALPVDIEAFVRGGEVDVPASRCFGLRLARDLVTARGGELELHGSVGTDAAIYMNFPVAS